jgi:hypothetical protein
MKYCPLCGAEYRQEKPVCAICNAGLVDSLDSPQARNNPAVLLWCGQNLTEFNRVAAALRDAEIPVLAEQGLGGLVGTLLNAISKIHVLQSDVDRALGIADEVLANSGARIGKTQSCFACGGECSAALARCPKCRAALIVEKQEKAEATEMVAASVPSNRKYCPQCDSRYVARYDHCSVCGVGLVAEELRGRPVTEQQRSDRIVIVWRSGDPVALCEALSRIRSLGLLHHVHGTCDHLVFGLAMPQPRYIIRIFASDAPLAAELLADTSECLPFGLSYIPSADDEPFLPPERPKFPWNFAAATKEIWSADDSALTGLVEACFFENRIGVRRQGTEPGMLRLYVMAQDETVALEIVRQVREGAPLA